MRKVYLSHSFSDRDRALVANVDALIRSHGLIPTNSRTVGGGPLTDGISADIGEADALIALFTLRPEDPNNQTHPFVREEYGHARFKQMTAVALYEIGVNPDGVGAAGYEYIEYDPADALTAFMRLSTIIGQWRRRAGRQLKVQLMPEEIAREIGRTADQCVCEYRWNVDGRDTDWQQARILREVGGVFAYLRVPDEAPLIQIRIHGPAGQSRSAYTPLWTSVTLEA